MKKVKYGQNVIMVVYFLIIIDAKMAAFVDSLTLSKTEGILRKFQKVI
jgi:hypothetical protein